MKATQFNPWSKKPIIIQDTTSFGTFHSTIATKFEGSMLMSQMREQPKLPPYQQNVQLCEENTQKKLRLISVMHDQKYRSILNPEVFRENVLMLGRLEKICQEVELAYDKCARVVRQENETQQFVLNDSTVQVEMAYENRLDFFNQIRRLQNGIVLIKLEDIDTIERTLKDRLKQLQQVCQ